YAGIVTFVGRNDATVELAPGIAGSVSFSSMTWARPFKPEHPTPAPRAPSDVVSVGQVVAVRVTHMQTVRTSSATRVLRLELGLEQTPEVITDPWTGKAWKPQNFEKDEFDGQITLRKALAESKNTVAVKLLIDVGIDKVRSEAHAAGILSDIPQSYTAALGTGEVGILEEINAYATLASQGKRAEAVLIKRVLSRDGNTIFSAPPNMEQ